MRIGLDARFLTHPQRGGFKTYTENLIGALAAIDRDNEYVVYLDRAPNGTRLPPCPNFTYRVISARLPIVGMPAREQLALRRRVVADRLDLVHFLCNTATVDPPLPSIVTLHDTIQLTMPQSIRSGNRLSAGRSRAISAYSHWVIRRVVRTARRVITVSHFEKSQIVDLFGLPSSRVVVTQLAPGPDFAPASPETREGWRAKARKDFGTRDRFLLAVGFEPRKNIPLVIEAFARLAPDYPDLDLLIVAAADQSRALFRGIAEQAGIAHRVVVVGALPPSDLRILYNLTEAFVFPSVRESFGLPPLEAMACGAPVVAACASSVPEVVGDGALLAAPGSADDLTRGLSLVLSNPALREELSRRGCVRARQFSWERTATQTIAAYREAAGVASSVSLSLEKDGP